MLQSKIAETESAMAEHERESDTTLRKHQERLYDLHNAVNRLGQQNHTWYAVGYSQNRTRFISAFWGNIFTTASSEDRVLIGQGNIAAHDGNIQADAAYDGDLLRQIWPAHLLGHPCEHERLMGTKCDQLFICKVSSS